MSFLNQLDDNINDVQESGDYIPGGVRESAIYTDTIKKAYLIESQHGSRGVTLELFDGQSTFTTTQYITSNRQKGQLTYYTKPDGTKQFLAGYEIMENLCQILTGKGLSKQDVVPGVVNVYNFEAKGEIPTNVEVLPLLIGKQIKTGILKTEVTKKKKDPSSDTYVPTSETRMQNELAKVFDATTGQTWTEKKGNAAASYITKWEERYAGKVIDKKDKNAPKSGNPLATNQSQTSNALAGSTAPANSGVSQAQSLFDA